MNNTIPRKYKVTFSDKETIVTSYDAMDAMMSAMIEHPEPEIAKIVKIEAFNDSIKESDVIELTKTLFKSITQKEKNDWYYRNWNKRSDYC